MKKLHFTYEMQIDYSSQVNSCNFTIKCIPADTLRQKIDNIKINMYPETDYQWGKDGFKNLQIWGKEDKPHKSFRFRIEGDAQTGLSEFEECEDTDLSMVFSCPHGLNKAGETIRNFFDKKINNIDACTYDKVIAVTKLLFEAFKYQSGSTNVNTTAEEAFSQGCGVCQDYSHILIALLHLLGITARYVTGFIIGEGESHAWVEFLDDGKWYGIDPTNNTPVNDDYIKIGHGRDARDCTINRGIMQGGGLHTQTVSVNVREA
ncbi:MAG: transglutaminase family protein [Lachnospiraceae bacterium]|nr:transglutaminase family protein [Lachnospiraceae bacterium]